MSMFQAVRRSLATQVTLLLAAVVLTLTAVAAVVIVVQQRARLEAATLEKARLATSLGAHQYGDVLDTEIDVGALSVGDAFDRSYVLVKGWDFGKDPKYHTRYDAVTDRAVLPLLDAFLADEDFVFAIGVDDHGYIPTHNSKFSQPLTGVPEKDLEGNRTKRKADYALGLKAAQSEEPTLVQEYRRNTGELMWDVSSPIYVKGKHWGALRLGVSMDRIAAAQRRLGMTLAALFAVFFFATTGTMFVVIRRAMRPVVELTAAAEQIAIGDALETPIKSRSQNEIGQLTKSIDRLRSSMKAAMARLGH